MSIQETILQIPVEHQANVFGQFDQYIKKIERAMNVTVIARDDTLKVLGRLEDTQRAARVFEQLLGLSVRGNTITEQNVDYTIALGFEEKEGAVAEMDQELICHTINGRPVKPKTLGQQNYVDQIRKKMIVFGIGPAGTGKTYLAMAMAHHRPFKNDEVGRIILTRPAIEAGEKLGFLPGRSAEQDRSVSAASLRRPVSDYGGGELSAQYRKKGLIEVAPLAYMRGRTLDNAFIILDEAQNTTPAQMKMFLTRIGFGSKVIVTGDSSPEGSAAGARHPAWMWR